MPLFYMISLLALAHWEKDIINVLGGTVAQPTDREIWVVIFPNLIECVQRETKLTHGLDIM